MITRYEESVGKFDSLLLLLLIIFNHFSMAVLVPMTDLVFVLKADCISVNCMSAKLYQSDHYIYERHRHRYEVRHFPSFLIVSC